MCPPGSSSRTRGGESWHRNVPSAYRAARDPKRWAELEARAREPPRARRGPTRRQRAGRHVRRKLARGRVALAHRGGPGAPFRSPISSSRERLGRSGRKSPLAAPERREWASAAGRVRSVWRHSARIDGRRACADTVSRHCHGVGASAKTHEGFCRRDRSSERSAGRSRESKKKKNPLPRVHLGEVNQKWSPASRATSRLRIDAAEPPDLRVAVLW
jgi:hypothetical protein